MTSRQRGAAAGLTAALVLGLLAAVLGGQPAVADVVPEDRFVVTFDAMLPGESRTSSVAYTVPVEAVVRVGTVEVLETSGPGFTWELHLCAVDGACFDPAAEVTVPAGEYHLTTRVTLDPAAEAAGQSSALRGRIDFDEVRAESPGDLAATGFPAGAALGLSALAVLLGFWLLAMGRRHRDDDGGDPA